MLKNKNIWGSQFNPLGKVEVWHQDHEYHPLNLHIRHCRRAKGEKEKAQKLHPMKKWSKKKRTIRKKKEWRN
jgi:hypothetical protein